MNEKSKFNGHEREAPHSHLIQGVSPFIFISLSILDGFILNWTTQLNNIVPYFLRFIFCLIFLLISVILIYLSHKTIFNGNKPSDVLITDGILKHVRNPMYLGIFFIYIAFISLSISLISLAAFVIIFLLYNWMVKYEEGILEQLFGNDFLIYKKNVPRWIPKLTKKR